MRNRLLKLSFIPLALYPLAAQASQQCQGLSAVDPNGGGDCNTTGLPNQLNTIINNFFIVAGAIGVLIIVMAGIRYITSTGDAARIKAAKDTILYTIIGLVVLILARAIVGFVVAKVG